jgi:hypothetical protein
MVERVHKTINNYLRTLQMHLLSYDELHDKFDGYLSAVTKAINSTVHTTLNATPTQLVFRRDVLSYQSLSKLTGTTLPKGNSALSCKTTNERTPSGALTPTVSMTSHDPARAESQTWRRHLQRSLSAYRSK